MIVLLALTLYLEYNVWQSLSFPSNFFSLIYYHTICKLLFCKFILFPLLWVCKYGQQQLECLKTKCKPSQDMMNVGPRFSQSLTQPYPRLSSFLCLHYQLQGFSFFWSCQRSVILQSQLTSPHSRSKKKEETNYRSSLNNM